MLLYKPELCDEPENKQPHKKLKRQKVFASDLLSDDSDPGISPEERHPESPKDSDPFVDSEPDCYSNCGRQMSLPQTPSTPIPLDVRDGGEVVTETPPGSKPESLSLLNFNLALEIQHWSSQIELDNIRVPESSCSESDDESQC